MSAYDNTSPIYHVRHWRNVPEAEEAALEDFLAWLKYDDQAADFEGDIKRVKAIVDAYLGRNPKVVQGEKQLLNQWIEASKGA